MTYEYDEHYIQWQIKNNDNTEGQNGLIPP